MNRTKCMRRLGLAAAIIALAPATAMATAQGIQVMKKWQLMDKCTEQAHTAFPDYNPQSTAQRDAKMQECLSGQNLPPREDQARPR